jgi:uncharacterized protein
MIHTSQSAALKPGNINRITYDPYVPPFNYNPPVLYTKMVIEKDVKVTMRDGINVYVDVYRPDTTDKVPAILSFAVILKDLSSPEIAKALYSQPSWSSLWCGGAEAGDTEYFTTRGYAHIIGNPRGTCKSEDGPPSKYDVYDVIEWIASQPWCDGKIGMSGASAFGQSQIEAAKTQPPHLKAIFAFDPEPQYPIQWHPGGVLPTTPYLLGGTFHFHTKIGQPGPLPPAEEAIWQEAMKNPDYMQYPHLYSLLIMKGQVNPVMFYDMLGIYHIFSEGNPEDTETIIKNTRKIKIPIYTGAGWYGYTYKQHLLGACSLWEHLDKKLPKKFILVGLGHMERPLHQLSKETLRWYDYWLKGIDTGIMEDPPVKLWVMGANKWLAADDWPIPETQWTRLYLHSWERLRSEPFAPSSRQYYDAPDAFVQMPPSLTNNMQKLRYLTDPLPEDMLVAGPISLTLYASIDQADDNWIVILKDIGPDTSVRTAREGEREIPTNLPEIELSRGWLKASHRAIDPVLTRPWRPWHPLTRDLAKPVIPGEVNEYQIEIMPTANMFKADHRICIEITSMDKPTGIAGLSNVEYIPPHICSSKTTLHKVYHNEQYPSNLLLPVIPVDAQKWILASSTGVGVRGGTKS